MIDTHAHLTDPLLMCSLGEILKQADNAGIQRIMSVSTNIEDTRTIQKISSENPVIMGTAGVHPHEADSWSRAMLQELEVLSSKTAAIGEIGLDYFYTFGSHKNQRICFIEQLKLAAKLKLPVIIHCRNAYDDLIEILDGEASGNLTGIVHCFTGDTNQADELISRGFYLSFGGMLTFKKMDSIRDVFRSLPMDVILLETDSPYLTPEPMRGKTNTPLNIKFVYKKVSDLWEIPISETTRIIEKNFNRLFRINQDE